VSVALPVAAQCGHAVDATGVGVGEPRSGRLATADADLHSYSNGHPVGDARALQRAASRALAAFGSSHPVAGRARGEEQGSPGSAIELCFDGAASPEKTLAAA
jgi:hypothetical protein